MDLTSESPVGGTPPDPTAAGRGHDSRPPEAAGAAAGAAVGLPDADVPEVRRARDVELARDGWIRRFTGSPPRLGELKELYELTGREVLLDDVLPGELARECEGCALALSLFKVIYTRRRAP